jgi:hypothetical protein
MDRDRKRRLGFAIVGFENEESVRRLLEEKEINVGISCLAIEKAMLAKRFDKGRDPADAKQAFTGLTRKKE